MNLIGDFVEAISRRGGHRFRTTIEESVESHRICFEAEHSRHTGKTLLLE